MSDQPPARRLIALVVTYNRLPDLQVTVARLLDHPDGVLSGVVVVDNASTDGTQDWLATLTDPRLDVFRSATNVGGAGGVSIGMKRVSQNHDPDWVVVMDDDARPHPDAFATFHTTDVTQWDALAAAVYFPSGEICEMNRPSRNPFWHRAEFLKTLFGGGRRGFHLPDTAYESDEIVPIDVTSFVGFFISRTGIERAGYPDVSLFIYGDDGLYTLGLSKAGGQIGFVPDIRFEHDFTTFSGGSKRFRPLWKTYYHHRNLLMLYRQAAGWLFYPALVIILPKWVSKVRHHPGDRRRFLRVLWSGVRHGLMQRTDIAHGDVVKLSKPGKTVSRSEYRGDSVPSKESRKTSE